MESKEMAYSRGTLEADQTGWSQNFIELFADAQDLPL